MSTNLQVYKIFQFKTKTEKEREREHWTAEGMLRIKEHKYATRLKNQANMYSVGLNMAAK